MSARAAPSRNQSPPKRRDGELKCKGGGGVAEEEEAPPKSRSNSRKRSAAAAVASAPRKAVEPASSGGDADRVRAAAAGEGARSSEALCQFCGGSDSDELLSGHLLTGHGLTVHYFCMLFSSALTQGGSEEDGIFGFMPDDILKEIRRGKKLKCSYCRHTGATIGCVTKKCRKAFHFGCGKVNGALNQYFGTYSTYCSEHRPHQSAPATTSDRLSFHGLGMAVCPICTNSVETRASNGTLRSPCCASAGNAWYHRDCIQQMALSSGMHFIRCPLCNDRDRFISEMLDFGIYIPDRDASWEVEAGAYSELHTSHDRCDVQPSCCCHDGRDHKGGEGSPWEIFLCMSCGGNGIHLACYNRLLSPAVAGQPAAAAVGSYGNRKSDDSLLDVTWNCADCSAIMLKSGLQCDRTLRSMQNRQAPGGHHSDASGSFAAASGAAGARLTRAGRLLRSDGSGGAAESGSVAPLDSSIALAKSVAASLSLEPPLVLVADVSKHSGSASRGRHGNGAPGRRGNGGSSSAGGQAANR